MLDTFPKLINRPRLLIVEDELLVARDIAQQLEEMEYQVVGRAARGEEVSDQVEAVRPDLVLMDIQLAGEMDGITTAQMVHDRFGIPVIFLTAFASDEVLERAKLAEPFGYILKPFSERELKTVVEMALYKSAAQKAFRDTSLRTQAVLDNMTDAVITLLTDGTMESVNPAASRIFGYSAEELLGNNVSMLTSSKIAVAQDENIYNYIATGNHRINDYTSDMQGRHKDGSDVAIELCISEIRVGEQHRFVGVIRDVSEHKRHLDEVYRLAYFDELTGLPNRRLFLDRLKRTMLTTARSDYRGALMLLDLDNFKQLNDSLGHDIGDLLLKKVALSLCDSVREGDMVARMGGDEFAVLLEGISPDATEAAIQVELVAIKTLKALARSYVLGEHVYDSTPSIGIVEFEGTGTPIDVLFKQVDMAMYHAKAAGRNTLQFFKPAMQAAAQAHLEMERDLRIGLASAEFALHYQIQVDASGQPMGAEALLRWNCSTRGLVPPAKFIPVAEQTGLILSLGQWVLEAGCRQLAVWSHHPSTARWTLAVNVSARQFMQSDFEDSVVVALRRAGANPALLKLELTESMLVQDIESIIPKMNSIKVLGVSFSLDDFGTGYSSLSYLKRLPLSQLKIDQSFVRDVTVSSNDAVIARTVIALGQSLGLKVIAEGVETIEQRELLAHMGCDAFQGYYFGRPGPADALSSFSAPTQVST